MARKHVILGATGHVGSVVAKSLLASGEKVIAVVHDEARAGDLRRDGAEVAVVDVHDVEALRTIFKQGDRLFLLNPPASPKTDTDMEERNSLASILAAIHGSGLEKIVAESTYGAQPGEHVGDLGTLFEMEQALEAGSIPVCIVRAAYYMSNWDAALETAEKEGKVHTLYPIDFSLPMVAPEDIGRVVARLLAEDVLTTGIQFVEGPERYSARDVAEAFTEGFGRPVEAVTTPQSEWEEALKGLGFSEPAAASMANMTEVVLGRRYEIPNDPIRGGVSLANYVAGLVPRNGPRLLGS